MTTPDPDQETPPWIIPVRDPDPSVAAPSSPGLGQALGVLLLGVVAFTVAMVFGAGALVEDRDAGTAEGSVEVAGDGAEADGDPTTPPTTTTPATASTSTPVETTTTSTTSTSTTSTTSSTTTTVAATGTGSVPRLSASFDGGWVAQLTSVPQRSGVDRLEEAWDSLRGDVPDAVVAVSDDWSSLRPGYWVFVHPGPFASADQAEAFCEDVDRECLARELIG